MSNLIHFFSYPITLVLYNFYHPSIISLVHFCTSFHFTPGSHTPHIYTHTYLRHTYTFQTLTFFSTNSLTSFNNYVMHFLFPLILNVPFLAFERIYPPTMERNIDPFLAIRRAPELILFSNPPCKLAHVQQMTGLKFTMPTFFLSCASVIALKPTCGNYFLTDHASFPTHICMHFIPY